MRSPCLLHTIQKSATHLAVVITLYMKVNHAVTALLWTEAAFEKKVLQALVEYPGHLRLKSANVEVANSATKTSLDMRDCYKCLMETAPPSAGCFIPDGWSAGLFSVQRRNSM